jgi:hypothetical protein
VNADAETQEYEKLRQQDSSLVTHFKVTEVDEMLHNVYLFILYSHVCILFGSSLPHSFPPTPSLPDRICSALISNFVEEKA